MSFIVCPPIYYVSQSLFRVSRLLGKKNSNCVYEVNKSRGSEMHWGGRGFIKKIKTRFAGSPKKVLHAMYDCVFVLIIAYCTDEPDFS